MKKSFLPVLLGLGAVIWLLAPQPSLAFSSSLVSFSSDTAQEVPIDPGDAPTGVTVYGWFTEPGTQYTAVFSVDEEPAMVVAPGADLSMTTPWSYNADSKEVTVPFTAKEMIGGEMPEGVSVSMIALVPVVPEGEDGPPEAMKTGWMATNLQQWELIPPMPDAPYFGYKLSGPEGKTGFFHMFIPDAVVDLMSQMSGKTITIQELAVFNGDQQASLSIEEVEGGAFVSIKVLFSNTENSFVASSAKAQAASTTVTKTITVRPQQTVSMTAKKTSLKKGKDVELFGWLKSGKKDQAVTIYQKKAGEKKFTAFKTAKTKKDGYYSVKFKSEKTATYKAKFQTKESSTLQVKVN